MRDERYSIEVSDDSVVIYGDLTIEETFDFINFFDKKGFKSITSGIENSSLYLRRKSIEESVEEVRRVEHVESEKFYQGLYDQAKDRIKKLEKDVLSLEQLIKDLMTDEKKKQARIQREYENNLRYQQLLKLKEDPNVKIMLSKMGIMTEEQEASFEKAVAQNPIPDGPGVQVPFPFDWTYPQALPIPDCCATPPEGVKNEEN